MSKCFIYTSIIELPRPGDVVLASISNTSEDRKARGKVRPVILINLRDGQWRVIGLTTKSTYVSGDARSAIPDPAAIGLSGPGYLWSPRLACISTLDVGRIIGHVDSYTVDLLRGVITLPADWPSGDAPRGKQFSPSQGSRLKRCNIK